MSALVDLASDAGRFSAQGVTWSRLMINHLLIGECAGRETNLEPTD
jgi:hypothetical protein